MNIKKVFLASDHAGFLLKEVISKFLKKKGIKILDLGPKNENSVDYPEKDLLVSQLGTIKILEHAVLQGGIKRFVYAGSGCAIYGAQAPLPLKEVFISMHLSTPYQISKMAGVLYCNFYWHHSGLPIVKTRFFNCF